DATAGDLTPPADFFSQAVVHYVASASAQPVTLVPEDAKVLDRTRPNWRTQTGTPSTIVWDFTTAGMVARLYPQPASTVTNGLNWYYNARLVDLVADADTCPIMNAFPEFQDIMIPAVALSHLYLIEGGEADDQYQKWNGIYEIYKDRLTAAIKSISVAPGAIVGNTSYNR